MARTLGNGRQRSYLISRPGENRNRVRVSWGLQRMVLHRFAQDVCIPVSAIEYGCGRLGPGSPTASARRPPDPLGAGQQP